MGLMSNWRYINGRIHSFIQRACCIDLAENVKCIECQRVSRILGVTFFPADLHLGCGKNIQKHGVMILLFVPQTSTPIYR